MRSMIVIALVATISLVPAELAANCLSDYNHNLYVCDVAYCDNGVFTCLGCKTDALTGYYGCVLDATMN